MTSPSSPSCASALRFGLVPHCFILVTWKHGRQGSSYHSQLQPIMIFPPILASDNTLFAPDLKIELGGAWLDFTWSMTGIEAAPSPPPTKVQDADIDWLIILKISIHKTHPYVPQFVTCLKCFQKCTGAQQKGKPVRDCLVFLIWVRCIKAYVCGREEWSVVIQAYCRDI
jgi:hypothetical protein